MDNTLFLILLKPFSGGIYFDRKIDALRTPKLNSIISQISTIASELEDTKKGQNDFFDHLSLSAERAGFEPAIQFPVYKLSRLARSTTLTPLLNLCCKCNC